MKPLLSLVVALLLTPPGTPAGNFRWQRLVTPPPGAGLQQVCVVLDAASFANAGPALADLRLFQDGTELPYVIEESYDERSLNSGTTLPEDRSEFEPVLTVNLVPRPSTGAPGDRTQRNGYTRQPLRPGEIDPYAGTYNQTELPAHVPVERVRFLPEPDETADVSVVATDREAGSPPLTETVNGTVNAKQPVFPVTVGANLQHAAQLSVVIDHSHQVFTKAIFEMRRRSLCYQPRTAGALVLYLGGGQGMAAKTYGLANGFSTTAARPYGTLGPLEPNPDKQSPGQPARQRLLVYATIVAAAALLCALALAGARMLKARHHER